MTQVLLHTQAYASSCFFLYVNFMPSILGKHWRWVTQHQPTTAAKTRPCEEAPNTESSTSHLDPPAQSTKKPADIPQGQHRIFRFISTFLTQTCTGASAHRIHLKILLLIWARDLFTNLQENKILHLNYKKLLWFEYGYVEAPFLQHQDKMLTLQELHFLHRQFWGLLQPKGTAWSWLQVTNSSITEIRSPKALWSQTTNSSHRRKETPRCFDSCPTAWHISHSEWQLVFLQTRQEFGFERHLWKLKSSIWVVHKVFPSALKTGMMQLSERSQSGIFQQPQNMLNIKIAASVPIWLHSVGMACTDHCINEVHSLNSRDTLVNRTIEQLIEKHWEKSLCSGFLQQPVKTTNAHGHPKASIRCF